MTSPLLFAVCPAEEKIILRIAQRMGKKITKKYLEKGQKVS
jgi:hypothetical protein